VHRIALPTGELGEIDLQCEVNPQGVIEFAYLRGSQRAALPPDSFDRDRSDLLGLRFRVTREAGDFGPEQDLEGVNSLDVRGHRHDGDDSTTQALRRRIGGVVADHHRGSGLVGFATADRVEVDHSDLAALH